MKLKEAIDVISTTSSDVVGTPKDFKPGLIISFPIVNKNINTLAVSKKINSTNEKETAKNKKPNKKRKNSKKD